MLFIQIILFQNFEHLDGCDLCDDFAEYPEVDEIEDSDNDHDSETPFQIEEDSDEDYVPPSPIYFDGEIRKSPRKTKPVRRFSFDQKEYLNMLLSRITYF